MQQATVHAAAQKVPQQGRALNGRAAVSQHRDGRLLKQFIEFDAGDDGDQFSYRFADLVAGVFGYAESSLATTLEAWRAGGGEEHYAVLAAVLREAPNSFVFSEHAFVVRILRAARAVGRSAQKSISSSLFTSALGGVRSGIPGQPFATDLNMKERAEQMLASLAKSDPAHVLYNDIRAHAEADIERSRAEGRILDDEDADA